MSTTERIKGILREHGRLSVDVDTLSEESDLYQAGMTSHASVNVMLALEGAFDLEFPDRMLRRQVFGSVGSIRKAVEELVAPAPDSRSMAQL
jgi:acyl carrier protein